jgi:hypothetical protein
MFYITLNSSKNDMIVILYPSDIAKSTGAIRMGGALSARSFLRPSSAPGEAFILLLESKGT